MAARTITGSLRDLFVRSREPKRSELRAAAFPREKAQRAAVEKMHAERQYQKELSEGPLLLAALKAQGVDLDAVKKAHAEETAAYAEYRKKVGDRWLGEVDVAAHAVPIGAIGEPFCTDIHVHVCKDRVCVDQSMPIPVSDIFTDGGFDGHFARVSQNEFRADDSVEGDSHWNLTYHRDSQTHEGKIVILAAVELTEPAKVKGAGMRLEFLPGGADSLYAKGEGFAGRPDSWARAKAFAEFDVEKNSSGWHAGAKGKYRDTGKVKSRINPRPNLFNRTSEPWSRVFHVDKIDHVDPGDFFQMELGLSYWIKAEGQQSDASIFYGARAFPYLVIESCSYQYPETITINLGDYL